MQVIPNRLSVSPLDLLQLKNDRRSHCLEWKDDLYAHPNTPLHTAIHSRLHSLLPFSMLFETHISLCISFLLPMFSPPHCPLLYYT